jgi:hypothetical protein
MDSASLAAFKELIATETLPELGPGPRPGVRPLAILREEVQRFLAARKLTAQARQAFQAAALLWHDYLDESHQLSQGLPDANGSFMHAIMHRREPDYGNAKYWFRQVGRHPAFERIAEESGRFLEKEKDGSSLRAKLLPKAQWDPFAFVDACEESAPGAAASRKALLQKIQAIEFDSLLACV